MGVHHDGREQLASADVALAHGGLWHVRPQPAGPHIVNVLIHAANVALLFTLLLRLTNKLWPSAFIAALFAWHPLHVESVAWISERKDVFEHIFRAAGHAELHALRRGIQNPESSRKKNISRGA